MTDLLDQLKHAVLIARRTGAIVQVHATPAGDITGFTVPAADHDEQEPAAPAPEPDTTGRPVTRTKGPTGYDCNTGGHYDCGGCGCTCHRPATTWST